jgi:thioredoxin 1
MAKTTTDELFARDVIEASNTKPVLVDFWAEWCGPCRQLGPVIDQIAQELGSKIEVFKVNIDENPETPASVGVRGIPTLILYKDGKPLSTKVGSLPKSVLTEWIEEEVA